MKKRVWNRLFEKIFSSTSKPSNTLAPKKLEKENLTESSIRDLFKNCADVEIKRYEMGDQKPREVLLLYCKGLADQKQINQYVISRIESVLDHNNITELEKKMDLKPLQGSEEIISNVFSGHLILVFLKNNKLYTLNVNDPPQRTPEQSNTEISIKGPKDGFVEELERNVALVRKRLKTNSMCYESFTIGKRSRTKVALLYMNDIIQPKVINEARRRLQKINIDALQGSNQLEEILSDYSYSLFPLIDYTGRPDFVVDYLLHGRFVVLVNGSPTGVVGPANLTLLFKSPEDLYMPFYFVFFERILRLIGLILSIFLLGFWVALSAYNVEQIPFPLLATVTVSRIGLPLPAPLEALLMMGLFELFREAGARLPSTVGQTVAVVGGIIVGDAAIRAGLASTSM